MRLLERLERIGLNDVPWRSLPDAVETWWWLLPAALAAAMLGRLASGRRSGATPRPREVHLGEPRLGPAEGPRSDPSRTDGPDAQMELVSGVEFAPRRLLNGPEFGILRLLDKIVLETGAGHRAIGQASLGDVIAPKALYASEGARRRAFRSIDSKRLDFVIVDRHGMPVLAVDFQGRDRTEPLMREDVKRKAVRKAGIGFLEIPADHDADVIGDRIRSMLRPNLRTPASPIAALRRAGGYRAERESADLSCISVPEPPTGRQTGIRVSDAR